MTANTPAKSLVSKLVEAMSAIGGIAKKGRNDHHEYEYLRATDVAKVVRKELFKRGILLTSDEKEVSDKQITSYSGKVFTYVRLKVEYTLRDAASTETIVGCGFGDAMDSGDKAIYKAKTGALKYFLRSIGIIPDEKDDPEFDAEVDEHTDERVYAEPKANGKGKKSARVAEYQVRAFNSACHQSGKTAKQIAEYLQTRWSAQSIAELRKDEFTDAIKWAIGTQEGVVDALETSIAAVRKRAESIGAERREQVAQGD